MSVQGKSEKRAWKEWKMQGIRKIDERNFLLEMAA